MKFRKGLRALIARPGDLVVVEPGTYHRFANAAGTTAVVRCRIEPALRMEDLFEAVAALAADGRTLRLGLPRPLDLALFMREFRDEVAAPVTPGLVQPSWHRRPARPRAAASASATSGRTKPIGCRPWCSHW